MYVHKVKQFVFAVNRQALNVFLHRKYVFFHICIENRIARALVERTYKLHFFVLAEVSICEAVVQIFAVFGESVIARHTREFSNYRQFGQRAQTVLHVAFFILSRRRPGLETVREKSLVVLEITVVYKFGKHQFDFAFCAHNNFYVVGISKIANTNIFAIIPAVFDKSVLDGFFFTLSANAVSDFQSIVFYIHNSPQ